MDTAEEREEGHGLHGRGFAYQLQQSISSHFIEVLETSDDSQFRRCAPFFREKVCSSLFHSSPLNISKLSSIIFLNEFLVENY